MGILLPFGNFFLYLCKSEYITSMKTESILQGLFSVKQEKEIQMKMVLTRGESVLQNTSVEGVSVIEQQLKTLQETWSSLLSACIHCKR